MIKHVQKFALTLLVLFYLLITLTQLDWGIPNNNHPFSYHMDEWAQAQSLRTTFRYGTPHIWGGGNGTMFFYIISGILLIPFVLFGIVNPFKIKSSILFMSEQHRLFEVLRLQSIIYSVGSIIVIAYIAKRFFKSSGFFAGLFMAITPVFLIITTYYRYDAPVVFWILLSLLFSFRYFEHPTTKNFLLSGIISALAVTIKISAIPLFITYIFSFFLFTPEWKRVYKRLLIGILVFIGVCIIAGIPDALISFKVFSNWVYYTTFSVPNAVSNNISLGMPYQIFFLFFNYPSILGHLFYYMLICCLGIWIIWFIQEKEKFSSEYRKDLFLILSFGLFALSLFVVKIAAVGNRLLVILPFSGLICSIVIQRLTRSMKAGWKRKVFITLFISIIIIQVFDALSSVSVKLYPDPRQTSSEWMKKTIPKGSEIAIEAVPIFQDVPDFILKDYYTKQYIPHYHTFYTYDVIDANTKTFPPIVIITMDEITLKFLKNSEKRIITEKLKKQRYKKIKTFSPNLSYYHIFNDDKNYYFGGLVASPRTISVFERK